MLILAPRLPVPGSGLPGFLGSLGSVPPRLGVSPQLFSCLHHYQVPQVVDLPVQLVILFLGVVSRSAGNPFRFQALGCGHPPPTTPLRPQWVCLLVPVHIILGLRLCALGRNVRPWGPEWGLGSSE